MAAHNCVPPRLSLAKGGGLGKVAPTAIGPTSEQSANGVVDLVAADDFEAVALAKRYLESDAYAARRASGLARENSLDDSQLRRPPMIRVDSLTSVRTDGPSP